MKRRKKKTIEYILVAVLAIYVIAAIVIVDNKKMPEIIYSTPRVVLSSNLCFYKTKS